MHSTTLKHVSSITVSDLSSKGNRPSAANGKDGSFDVKKIPKIALIVRRQLKTSVSAFCDSLAKLLTQLNALGTYSKDSIKN